MAPNLLPVNERRALDDDGHTTSARSLYCPRRAREVDLGECFSCDRGNGVIVEGRRRWMVCLAAPRPPRAPPDASRLAATAVTPVAAIMTRGVLCIGHDVRADAAMTFLLDHALGAAPVVDDAGRAIGMLTKADVVRALRDDDRARARDAMSTLVLSVAESESIEVVAAFMAFEGMHHVLVLDDDRRVIGIVSSLDVVRWLACELGYAIDASSRG